MSKLKFYEYDDSTFERELDRDVKETIKKLTPEVSILERLTGQQTPSKDSAFSLFKEIISNPTSRTEENFAKFTMAIDQEYKRKGWVDKEKRIERDIIKYQLASFIALQPGMFITNLSLMKEMDKIRKTIFVDLAKRMGTKEFSRKVKEIISNTQGMKTEFIEKRSAFEAMKDSLFSFKKLLSKIYQAFEDMLPKSKKITPPPIPDISLIPKEILPELPNYPAPPIPTTPNAKKIPNGQSRD